MSGILNSVYNSVSFALYQHSKAMFLLQEQASTGSRINRASDDPSAAYQVLGLNSQERTLDNYMDNLYQVTDVLEVTSSIISSISSIIANKKVELTQIMSQTYDSDGRVSTANGINDALEQIVSLANTKHLNQYLFGGSDTDSAPYVVERTNGEISSVTYQGSSESLDVEVALGVDATAFYAGDDTFRSDNRSTPVFVGTTAAAVGTGTASVRGNVWLTVTESAGDYYLSIDGGTNTVNVTTAPDIANIAVKNSDGQVLYVDATNIASTGVDLVRVQGTYDIFNMLISVRDTLRKVDDPSFQISFSEIRNCLVSSLDEIKDLLVDKESSIGSKVGFLDNLNDTLRNIKYNTQDQVSNLQDADITQVAIDLSRREVLYQMSLSVAGRFMSMSLLDFI